MTDKTFDARVIGSITTGVMLFEHGMGPIHEAFEHILGHDVWTHELASPGPWEKARKVIADWYPAIPSEKPTDYRVLADRLLADYPDGVTLPRGTGVRSKGPVETLVDMLKR